MRRLWLFSVAIVVALLAACGGRTSTLPPLSGTANSNTGPTLSAPTTNGQTDGVAAYFTFLVPAGSGVARSPLYVSLNTQSFVILTDGANPQILNINKSSPSCQTINNGGSLSCTIAIRTTAGRHTFTITSYSQANGRGSALSTNSTGPIVVKGGDRTPISITLEGIVASAVLTPQTTNPPTGTAVQIPLTVVLKDASGAIIVGSGSFNNPITLTSSDMANGPLSKTALKSPAHEAGITANYNGAKVPNITYSATGNGLAAANVTNVVLSPSTPITGSTGITFTSDRSLILAVGSTGTLSATGSTGTPVSWSSSNTSVATIDASGNVQALSKGSASIMASSGGDWQALPAHQRMSAVSEITLAAYQMKNATPNVRRLQRTLIHLQRPES